MNYFTFSNKTDLKELTKELKSILGIKQTRTRDRHASAMGCNSNAHLVGELHKKGSISTPLDDYLAILGSELKSYHQIELTSSMILRIHSLADKYAPVINDGLQMHYYLGWLPFKDITDQEDQLSIQLPIETLGDIEQLHLSSDEFDFDFTPNNKPKALHLCETLKHNVYLNLGLTILMNPTKMPVDFMTEHGQVFHYLGTETLSCDEGDIITFDNLDEECYFEGFISPVMGMDENISILLKKHLPTIQLNISVNELSVLGRDNVYPDESDIEEVERYSLFNPTLTVHSKGLELSISPLASVLTHKFDSEFIEAYTCVPWVISSNPIFKVTGDIKVSIKSVQADNHLIKLTDYLWVEALRSADNMPINETDYFVGQENDLVKIFEQFNIKKIECYALIGHDSGDETIMGCIGLDINGLEQIRFQIDLFSCSDFFHEWLPKLNKNHGIEFNIQKDFEYEFSRVWIETEYDEFSTFMFPEYIAPAFSLAFLIFDTKQRVLPNKCVDLIQHPNVLSEGIQDTEQRKATILPPMHFPLTTKAWHSDVCKVINSQYRAGKNSNDEIATAIKQEIEPQCTENTSLVCAPILFHCTASNFETIQWNCSVVYSDIGRSPGLVRSREIINPLEEALGLKPIESFIFKVIKLSDNN
jgi:hypothetical protein